jgi:hypothetical protein
LDLRETILDEAGEKCIIRSFIICTLHRIGGNVVRMGEMRKTYKLLVGKPEGKRIYFFQDMDHS